jgi:2-methylcitrate dehydratase PrpD
MLAVALGYEAALRVGEAVNPSHYEFWHPTGTAATFGAAAAAGHPQDVGRGTRPGTWPEARRPE